MQPGDTGSLGCEWPWHWPMQTLPHTLLIWCRASNQRGMRIWTFWIFAWAHVGLIRTDFVSIGLSYLILSVRTYSSQTCTRDTPQKHTMIISHLAVFSPYSLYSFPSSVLSSLSYSMAFTTLNNTPFHSHEWFLSLPLGANPYLFTRYMLSSLWVLNQNTQHGPTRSI